MNDINTHVPSYGGPQAASRDDSVAAMNNVGSAQKYRSEFALLIIFWAYVTATNIIWGMSMKANLASIGVTHVFADANERLLQHLILFPALLGAMWLSRRIGWQPLWRSIPLQLLCALLFAALGNPAMNIAIPVAGGMSWHDIRLLNLSPTVEYPLSQTLLWAASVMMFLINYIFCLALVLGFEFYRRYRDSQLRAQELERSLGAAHLAALRMQLSPHTLFNLLHTIRGHVSWDPEVAQSMIVQLGDLLRRALRAGEHELTRLQDELQFVRLYLQLQQRRFADRLILVVPDADAGPSVWVPSLILQPLVENAIVHGLAQPQSPVTVRVEIAVDGETLILRVVNSMPSTSAVTGSSQVGIGLKNVRERLAIQFGDRAACQAGRTPTDEWVAELRLPMLHGRE
jgi:Histidine kinase